MKIQVLNNKIFELVETKGYSGKLIDEIELEIENWNENKKLTILDLVKFNLTTGDIKSLNFILGILFSTYNFDGEIEQKISVELTNTLNSLTQNHYELNKSYVEFSYYLIFDIYFHNAGLIEELNNENTKLLIREIEKIGKIEYSIDKSKDSDLLMALQKIIDLVYYFEKDKAEEILKSNFLTHFDEFVRDCAKDELKINCA
ncbi:hypothetical protein [Tenacibaculum finnmarkense]|uniref:hypothetical protein n=1 Tax=Tenacibaculum finnmarkense TaxID=2781243 RepID=UPI001EFB4AFC|nr:hypothetical protein [Tenacibaculum finnmarkense]